MFKNTIKRGILILFVFGFCLQAGLCGEKVYNAGVESKQVLLSTTNALGKSLKYPSAKTPEVTGIKVTIPPGQETGWHTHSVPGYAYVISGELTIEYAGGLSKTFKAGEAFSEVVDTAHNGRNKGAEDVVLIAFFTGDRGVPFTKKLMHDLK